MPSIIRSSSSSWDLMCQYSDMVPAFVPTQGMPAWLRVAADWNPFSAIAAACRHLFGNPNPSALARAWPMQHPELAVLLWSGVLLAVFVPLAVRLYATKE